MNHKLKWVILVSILLNIFLVGILFGQLPRRFDGGGYYQRIMEQAVKRLPASEQAPFRVKMDHMRAEADPIRNQIRATRDETVRIVTTEPFDEIAFDRQVKKINDLRVQMAAILKKAAKELPLEQRIALGEALKRPSAVSPR
jgi:uncharacterized membrane protein